MLFNKNTISLFVDDALRTASILKNHASSIYSNSKERYLHGFEHRELYVRPLSFEKMLSIALVNVSNGRLEHELCLLSVVLLKKSSGESRDRKERRGTRVSRAGSL